MFPCFQTPSRFRSQPNWGGGFVAPLLMLIVLGCRSTDLAQDRTTVACQLRQRTGHEIAETTDPGRVVYPGGASLEDGLTREEAITLALWNNAAFQELLVDLKISRGDLIQAGLLPNPEFIYLFGVDEKPFRYALELPLEAFWLRPIRVRAGERELERTRDRLVQAGLDLIRDVRQAYADILLVRERLRIAEEAFTLRHGISEIAERRLAAGDASAQEAAAARIDALLTKQDAVRARGEIPVVEERLRNLLGLGGDRRPLVLETTLPPNRPNLDVEALVDDALATRPDAQAVDELTAAAQERLRIVQLGWVRVLGIADATSGKRTGHEFGPAVRFTVPLFNWNQGGIARAQAEVEKAQRQKRTLHDQIILDVRKAHAQYQQARSELDVLKSKVRPEVEAAIARSQKAYREGNASYLIVLETTRQLLDTLLREAQLHADLQRSWAELERSAGHHLDDGRPTPPTLLPPVERGTP